MSEPETVLHFHPLPYYSEEDQCWYPSVKVTLGDRFIEWQVFELGFDEARFTLPYARQFAREFAMQYERTLHVIQQIS